MIESAQPDPVAMARMVAANPSLLRAMAPGRSLAGLLKSSFRDPRLRQLFGRYATYVGGSPYRCPALLSLIWQAEAAGVWVVEDGMHALAAALAALIEARGGRLRYNAHVSRILSDSDGVTGVALSGGMVLPATRVIFNGDPRALALGHLGAGGQAVDPRLATAPRTLSAQVWAFRAAARGPDLAHHNVFFCADAARDFRTLERGRLPAGYHALPLRRGSRAAGVTPARGTLRDHSERPAADTGAPRRQGVRDMPPTDLPGAQTLRPELFAGAGKTCADDAKRVRRALSGQRRVALRAEPARDARRAPASAGAHGSEGALPVRRRVSPGSGGPDGGHLRPARGRGDLDGPNFNLAVPPNGYAWWYVDALSDCGTRALSVIGFIGSVFSPWYAWSGRRDPENHVCINVATCGPGGRFTMTDRGRGALRQSPRRFEVGPSAMTWERGTLVIDVNEISGPPAIGRVRGRSG